MRDAARLALIAIFGLASWAGLLLFMNRVSPSPMARWLFLGLLFVALSLTATLLAYAISRKRATALGKRPDLRQALRRGVLVGILGAVFMALQLVRALTLSVALALIMAAVVFEALFHLGQH